MGTFLKFLPKIVLILREASRLRDAVMSRHTRVQWAGNAAVVFVGAVIVAGMVQFGVISGEDFDVQVGFLVALLGLIGPLISRAIAVHGGISGKPSSDPDPGAVLPERVLPTNPSLRDLDAVPGSTYLLRVRRVGEVHFWHGFNGTIEDARRAGEWGYGLLPDGREVHLESGVLTGRVVRVPVGGGTGRLVEGLKSDGSASVSE